MKDWYLKKRPYGNTLLHNRWPCSDGLTTKKYRSYWYCTYCKKIAPKEMGFVAELAECNQWHVWGHEHPRVKMKILLLELWDWIKK